MDNKFVYKLFIMISMGIVATVKKIDNATIDSIIVNPFLCKYLFFHIIEDIDLGYQWYRIFFFNFDKSFIHTGGHNFLCFHNSW